MWEVMISEDLEKEPVCHMFQTETEAKAFGLAEQTKGNLAEFYMTDSNGCRHMYDLWPIRFERPKAVYIETFQYNQFGIEEDNVD